MKYFKIKNEIEELKRQTLISIKKSLKLERENEELKRKIKHLKEPKAILNIDMTPEELAEQIVKKLNKDEQHKCTPECFGKHVIKAIQKDYDSCSKEAKPYFLMYWYDNLSAFYPWLEKIYIVYGKIYFKSKESST